MGAPKFTIEDRSEYKATMKGLLDIDPARTAVVTIDAQHNYLNPEIGGLPVVAEDAAKVVKATERLLDVCRAAGMPILHTYTVRRQIEIDNGFFNAGIRLMQAGIRRKISQLPHADVSPLPDRVEGSKQSTVIDSLVKEGDLHLTTKRTMDSFQYTELDMLLFRVFNVDTVLLTGINTDTCVMSTTFSAANRGLQPVVVSDCVASTRGRDSHEMALELMSRSVAWVLNVDEIAAKISEFQAKAS